MLLVPILLYLVSHPAVPDPRDDRTHDLRVYYYEQHRWMQGLLIAALYGHPGRIQYALLGAMHPAAPDYVRIAVVALLLPGIVTDAPEVHTAQAILLIALAARRDRSSSRSRSAEMFGDTTTKTEVRYDTAQRSNSARMALPSAHAVHRRLMFISPHVAGHWLVLGLLQLFLLNCVLVTPGANPERRGLRGVTIALWLVSARRRTVVGPDRVAGVAAMDPRAREPCVGAAAGDARRGFPAVRIPQRQTLHR